MKPVFELRNIGLPDFAVGFPRRAEGPPDRLVKA